MRKCEQCKVNDAPVELQVFVNGKIERHYFCRNCAAEMARGAMGVLGTMPGGAGMPLGNLFGAAGGAPAGGAGMPGGTATTTAERQAPASKTPTLDQFGRDLTGDAAAGKLDPAAGREREIRRLITVLGRRQKNNPVLLGEPGVGKTAIVEGLANRIVQGNVPVSLRDKRIISLPMGNLISGAMFRGQFEERLKGVVDEVRASEGQIILFLDELHTIVGTGAAEGAMGAGDILKPALARGDLRCIGATTRDEYRKHVEKDAALERRFQPILVDEPTVEEAITMLQIVRPYYEKHHGVVIQDAALEAAAKLSDRYINDRFLPDKGIDVMDEASSALHLEALERGTPGPELVASLEQELSTLQAQKEAASLAEDYAKAAALKQQEVLTNQKLEAAREEAKNSDPLTVTPERIAAVVQDWTGVPVTEIMESERMNLLHLEDDLSARVIGQEEAISAVARSIRRSRAGLKDPKRPIGSFLFLGPTGVGKTELARALAATLFGSTDAMIRLDMSEYMEPHTVARLFGSPPGYVGHDEGGQLTEAVRRRPYSVVLFDEVEKAHPEVFNALLQIMDDGRLTDGQGRTVDFKNTLVIMTSNVGSADLRRVAHMGFMVKNESEDEGGVDTAVKSRALDGLRRAFRPEFLNRIDQVVVFNSLSRADLRKIVDLLLGDVEARLKEQGIGLEITDEVGDFLIAEGYSEEYGARPLRRSIQTHVDDALADSILAGTLHNGQTVRLTMVDGKITAEIVDTPILEPVSVSA